MTIKLLNKNATSFLTEPFAENILSALKYNKRVKRLVKKRISEKEVNQLSLSSSYDFIKNDDKFYSSLYSIKGETESEKMRKAEAHIIKQILMNNASKDPLTTQANTLLSLLSKFKIEENTNREIYLPSLLFSLHQIRNESYQQARVASSKRIQNKSYSEFKNQLRECKKVRLLYGGLSKREFQKSVRKVQKLRTVPKENLLIYLETRLDVTLERSGFFPSIRAARQFILHGRIQVNFKIIKIPSYQLKSGDIINVKLKKSNNAKKTRRFSSKIFNSVHSVIAQGKYDEKQNATSIPWPLKSKQKLNTLHPTFEDLFRRSSTPFHERKLYTQTHFYFQSVLGQLFSTVEKFDLTGAAYSLNEVENFRKRSSNSLNEVEDLRRRSSKPSLIDKQSFIDVSQSAKASYSSNPFLLLSSSFAKQSLLFRSLSFLKIFEEDLQLRSKQLDGRLKNNLFDKINELFINNTYKTNFAFQDTSLILPFLKEWRFIVPSYALLSLMHAQFLSQCLCKQTCQSDVYPQKAIVYPIKKYIPFNFGINNCMGTKLKIFEENLQSIKYPSKFRESIFNFFSYWLEMKKKCLNLRHIFWRQGRSIFPVYEKYIQRSFSQEKQVKAKYLSPCLQTNYRQKESKPLHLEISYQSLSAVFLYPPQQIYLPATVDLDLILKSGV